MKAVILAGGEGTRMRPLTLERPKPLLEVIGKPLIHYTFQALPDVIDEVIVVVNYKADMIMAYLGDRYEGRRVSYARQEELNGTAGALLVAKEKLVNEEKFLVTMSDDLYAKSDLERCIQHSILMMVYRSPDPVPVGSINLDERGYAVEVVEGGGSSIPNPLINTNVFMITPDFFNHPMVPKAEGSRELGLPQSLIAAYPGRVETIEATFWLSLTEPKDLERAAAILKK